MILLHLLEFFLKKVRFMMLLQKNWKKFRK